MENAGKENNTPLDQWGEKSKLRRINLSGDRWVNIDEIPGFYFKGIQYFDFKKIDFINNNGLANLIKFLKGFLEKGIDVQFVNVSESIKKRMRSLGLDHIINCK